MTRNVTDLSSRLRCNQPATQTRSPTCALRSLARTRIGVMGTPGYSWLSCPLGVRARRELAVPPHFAGPGAGTAATASLARSRGLAGGASGRPLAAAAVTPRTREGLRYRTRGRLSSFRRLSVLATPGATRLRQRVGVSVVNIVVVNIVVTASSWLPGHRGCRAIVRYRGQHLLVKGARRHVRILPAPRPALPRRLTPGLRPEWPVRRPPLGTAFLPAGVRRQPGRPASD